ncbi:MAG: hypothetical protein D6737_09505 [Chloroflexi bacterium]|nr:MAG: hypothetical protein D6737_09505 [Chloroflexota bacterium]
MNFPEQRHVIAETTIRRERLLPDNAIGTVTVKANERVDVGTVVARGTVPTRYIILDAQKYFRLKNPDELEDLLFVEQNDVVDIRQPIAGKSATKGRRLVSPVTGIVAQIDQGRIILQETPEVNELEAGLNGQVLEELAGRGVIIEASGTLVQGVWGNGRRMIGLLRMEPRGGLASLVSDELEMRFRGTMIVTRDPLTSIALDVMATQAFAGVIAPSMSPALRQQAIESRGTIMLTEGFGDMRMNIAVYNLLRDNDGEQATLDAVLPDRMETDRPELIINRSYTHDRPPRPQLHRGLEPEMEVRLTRHPYAGQLGHVVDLPKTPCMLDNGLRVPCARVELISGETVLVPFANLEVFGQ